MTMNAQSRVNDGPTRDLGILSICLNLNRFRWRYCREGYSVRVIGAGCALGVGCALFVGCDTGFGAAALLAVELSGMTTSGT